VAYACTIRSDLQQRAKYEKAAAKTGKRPYGMAISDYLMKQKNEPLASKRD
jgi:hypothetical protein